jgi:hypothetical protein
VNMLAAEQDPEFLALNPATGSVRQTLSGLQ